MTTTMETLFDLPVGAKHPAQYSLELYLAMARYLEGCATVLDPMAGVGGIHKLRGLLPGILTVGIELEPEWAARHPDTQVGNALALPFSSSSFDAICVSPAYGNRMADHHEARDDSPRHTYRHYLGRPLSAGNGGGLQWGDAYRDLHQRAWAEAKRVLRPGGRFVLNCKDHYRNGELMNVTAWHIDTLEELGFTLVDETQVPARSQRHGANGGLRAEYETVALLRLAEAS